ncbi:MAG: hypothetical protein ACRCU2_17750, partial [Planktothrix sp.]
DDFSLVLYRLEGQLSLLITGLETKDRTDNRTRKIRNSVLWVGDDSIEKEEEILRNIAIKALEGELEAKVDLAITENKEQGFNVNFDGLKNLKPDSLDPAAKKPDDSHKIGNLSAWKEDLISELKQYCLPKTKQGMLVVVSSTVSKPSLKRVNVWRGLSDAISDDEDEWDLPVKGANSDNFRFGESRGKVPSKPGNSAPESIPTKNPIGNQPNDNKINTGVIQKQGLTIGQTVVSVLLVISLIANIGLFLKWQDAIDNKKEYEKLLDQSQALKVEIVNNENKIKTQEQKIDEQNLKLQKGGQILDGIQKFTARFNSPELRGLLEDNNDFLKGIQK